MFPFITLLSSSGPTGNQSRLSSAMEIPERTATVDQEAATVESTDEARTVPQDVQTVARPHLMTLMYRPDTPAKLTDKFPPTPLYKRDPNSFVMGRGQNLDVLLNDEHMPRKFVEVWCKAEEDGTPKWYVKNLSDRKPVRLELAGNKVTVKLNEVKELRDGHKLKLEMTVFTVRIEDGDLIERAEFGLEFRLLEDGSTGSSGGSFRRQTSSSTDSSGSITSATELARQAYGSSPVLGQNGFHVNQFGHVLPVGSPAHALGPVHPPGQFHPQAGFVYPLGGQVPAPGVAMHPGGGPVVYYPATCTASLSGVGSHLSAASSHTCMHAHCSHLDCCQHHPSPQVCFHPGCNAHVNPAASQSHQHPALANPTLAGPGVGSRASAGPGPYPGVGSHASAGNGSYPPVANRSSTGPGPYPGVDGHASTTPSPSLGPNSVFYNFPGGGNGPPVAGSVPPGQTSVPPTYCGPHGQQGQGQPPVTEGMPWVRQQAPATAMPQNNPSHGLTSPPGSNQHFVHNHQAPRHQSLSDDSTRVKEPVLADCPGPAGQPVGPGISADQSMSFQYPTLYTQEHYNPRFPSSGEFLSSQQQQQQQNQLSHRLHGPLSMPPHQDWAFPHDQRGLYSRGYNGAQGFVRAPDVISQPESAAVPGMPVHQSRSAVIHNLSGQQPESAMVHNLSGRQSQSSMVHDVSDEQCDSPLFVQNISAQQPESAALYNLRDHQQPESSSPLRQQVIAATREPLVGTPAPAFYSPSGGLPVAPPVAQLSSLTLSSPMEVTTPYPIEEVSATPANSLSHGSAEGSAGRAYYLHTTAAASAFAPRGSHVVTTDGASYGQLGRGGMPFAGNINSAQPFAGQMPGNVPSVSAPHLIPSTPQMYSAPELRQNVNLRELPQAGDGGGARAAFASLNQSAANGNRVNLRCHEGIAAPTPPSSDFSSEGSYRVQDLQQGGQGTGQDSQTRRRQPQEDDERQPQEHEDQG